MTTRRQQGPAAAPAEVVLSPSDKAKCIYVLLVWTLFFGSVCASIGRLTAPEAHPRGIIACNNQGGLSLTGIVFQDTLLGTGSANGSGDALKAIKEALCGERV